MTRKLQLLILALDDLLLQQTSGRFRIVLWDHKQDGYVYADHAEVVENSP